MLNKKYFIIFSLLFCIDYSYAGLTFYLTSLGSIELFKSSEPSTHFTKRKWRNLVAARDDALVFVASNGKEGKTIRFYNGINEVKEIYSHISDMDAAKMIVAL